MYVGKLAAFFCFVQFISASALTFSLGAQEVARFFVATTQPGTSINFYFAVQSGGSFDVDFAVRDPNQNVVLSDEKTRQGEYTILAKTPGEYEFKFSNTMSTFAEKVIDFEIKVEDDSDVKATMPERPNSQPNAHVENMKNSVEKIDKQLDNLLKKLHYYKTRNNRNHATVKSTESRIFYFSVLEVLLMVGMAVLQVTIVQLFFKGSRKQLV